MKLEQYTMQACFFFCEILAQFGQEFPGNYDASKLHLGIVAQSTDVIT